MSDYTPTTGIVKAAYMVHMNHHENIEHEDGAAEFDRWLAEHDRQIAAEAWDEGYEDRRDDEHEHRPGRKYANPYKEQP